MSIQMDNLVIKILGDAEKKEDVLRIVKQSAEFINTEEGVVVFACSDNRNQRQNLEMYTFNDAKYINELYALDEHEFDVGTEVPCGDYEFNLWADVIGEEDVIPLQLSVWKFKIVDGTVTLMLDDSQTLKYWSGGHITKLPPKHVFVFGSNPEGRHGAGAAKAAIAFGAKLGQGRGMQGNAYGLVTKNLTAGYTEQLADGEIHYPTEGWQSVSADNICKNIAELYAEAKRKPDLKFIIGYMNDGNNLNGYSSAEMFWMFTRIPVPANVYFHDSFKGDEKAIVIDMDKTPKKRRVVNRTSTPSGRVQFAKDIMPMCKRCGYTLSPAGNCKCKPEFQELS
ncbi:hypothetical protein MYOV003v1_p0039 [Vibrio phage 207E48.1]|nr:hypothetical protein MYOV003v1_p0039 [Vibrio phage 207E48.1]